MIDRRTLEAFAEAISHFSGYNDPTSALYKARNPGGLRPMKPEHPHDELGNRVFKSMLDGMQALIFDLEVKLGGRLAPTATINDLAASYGRKATEAQAWVRFIRQALKDDTINARTQISKFLEDIHVS